LVTVLSIEDLRFLVKSATETDTNYIVNFRNATCECLYYKHKGRKCKHYWAIVHWLADPRNYRSSTEQNNASDNESLDEQIPPPPESIPPLLLPLPLTLEDNNDHSVNVINGVIISKTSDVCECGVFVGGSEHECDRCNRKMHSFCGTGIGKPGFGQPRRCSDCAKTVSLDVTTKPKPGRPKKMTSLLQRDEDARNSAIG